MVSFLVFLAILIVVAVTAHYIIAHFGLPAPVRVVVGILLLLALVLYVFGAFGNPALIVVR